MNEEPENEVPFGSLEEEVADDIPVMLSEGEYVIPADVVRYWGLKHLEEMRMMAKCGLMSMQQDGRLHMVDEEGKPVETEAQSKPQIEVVEIDIQAMQDDMSKEEDDEEEDDNDMDKQMELFEDNVIEVDFDGKDKEDIVHAELGGDMQRDVQNALGFGFGQATLSISPDVMSTALGNIGAFGTGSADIGRSFGSQDVANALSETLSDPDKQKDLAREVVDMMVDEAVATQEPLSGSKTVDTAIAIGSQLASPKGVPSITSAVTGPSVTVATDMLGNPIGYNVGGNAALQAVAKAALTDLVDIGFNISKGVQSPTDLGVLGGQLVGVSTGTTLGVPTQSLTGTVPTQMSVDDYDRAVAGMLGVDVTTVGTNDVTGRPDYSVATDLIGVQTDPNTGMATTGGYTQTGGYQDMLGNISAMGTVADLNRMGTQELDQLGKTRGFKGILGLDKSEFDKARDRAEKREQQQYDDQAGGVMGATTDPLGTMNVADLEAQADKEKEQQEEQQQEMMDMMSDDETLGEVENDPETEEGQDQGAEE